MGFVDFIKLSFALSSLAQPFDQMASIPEYVFVVLSQRKADTGRFQRETAEKRTAPITKWPPRRLLFTRLEVVFITIPGECCLEGLINLACWLQLQMLPRLNGHFMNVLVWFRT